LDRAVVVASALDRAVVASALDRAVVASALNRVVVGVVVAEWRVGDVCTIGAATVGVVVAVINQCTYSITVINPLLSMHGR
jgi:hypothetical protein